MSFHHFLTALGNKLTALLISHQTLENILILKAALILTAASLFISCLALLILVVSQHRLKTSSKPAKSNVLPITLHRNTNSPQAK